MKQFVVLVSGSGAGAILFKGRRIVCRTWVAGTPDTSEQTLAAVLAERPAKVLHARVVLESDLCPVKVVQGLPPVSTPRLRRLVRFEAARWFLMPPPLVTDAAWHPRRRGALVAAAPEALVSAVVRAVEATGIRVECVVAGVCVAHHLPDGTHVRRAGAVEETLEVRRGRLVTVHRRPVSVGDGGAEGEWEKAAHAAATTHSLLRLEPPVLKARRAKALRLRWLTGAAAAGLVAMLSAAGYVWRLEATVQQATQQLAAIQPRVDGVLASERESRRHQDVARVLKAAEQKRGRDLLLLHQLTRDLPDSVFLLSLDRDRAGRVRVERRHAKT